MLTPALPSATRGRGTCVARIVLQLAAPLALLLLLASCGSDSSEASDPSSDDPTDVSGSDTGTDPDASTGTSDPTDVDPDITLPAMNACGGAQSLVWEGNDAAPGDPCGEFGEGTLVCTSTDILQCVNQAALNLCGTPGELSVEIGTPCGVCAGVDDDLAGTWVCGNDGTPVCIGGRDWNACGGCAALDARPGALCDDGDGRWVCSSREELTCLGIDSNACGGTGVLRVDGQPALPGDACEAACGPGVLVCSDTTPGTLECEATDEGLPPNACGGCDSLPARVGDDCGFCGGGTWNCNGEGSLSCDAPTLPDACGGCTDLAERPGQPCEVDGIWLCAGNTLTCGTVIRPEDRNACGGGETLSVQPGAACGTCGDGLQVCVSPNAVQCLGGETLNACDGCGPLRGAPDQPCGECGSGSLACTTDNTALECEGDLGAEARNACGRCAELPVDLGDACGTCLEWACGPTGGVRCELNASLPGCAFDTCASLGCSGQNRSCIPSDGSSNAVCDVCLKGFVERSGACVVDDGGSTGAPETCTTDDDCTGGEVCRGGSCEPPPSDPPCADPSLTRCGADCVDTQTNSEHCGTCGTDCGAFTACDAGTCGDLCDEPNGCQGCNVLEGAPGEACGDCGSFACVGREALMCEDPGFNACAGCGELGAPPSTSCGPCGNGHYQCSGDGSAVVCQGATTDCSWSEVSVGGVTCALTDGGTLWCFGPAASGLLGAGVTTDSAVPLQVRAAEDAEVNHWSDWTAVSTGGTHTCGLRENGTLWCWGDGRFGRLGNGEDEGIYFLPVQVRSAAGSPETHWNDWAAVNAGSQHTCGIREEGTLWCWGAGGRGQLGNGDTGVFTRPVQVANASGTGSWTDWIDVSVGGQHTCGIREGGTLWCWGSQREGQLGNGIGEAQGRTTPGVVSPAEEVGGAPWQDWIAVGAGADYTCGIREGGTLWCWGYQLYGQLGNGVETDGMRTTPGIVVTAEEDEGDPWTDWTELSVGQFYACGLREDLSLWCWGDNTWSALGNGTMETPQDRPRQVVDDEGSGTWTDWIAVSGRSHSCGIRDGGSLWCWGFDNGRAGRFGNPDAGFFEMTPLRALDPGTEPEE